MERERGLQATLPPTAPLCPACSAEHRLDPVAADAASALLPVWMASQEQQGAGVAAPPQPPQTTGGNSSQREVRAAAEAACNTLQRAGIPARLMQLSYGDPIAVFDLGRRGEVGVVLPCTPSRVAANDPRCLLGSAIVCRRVLAARGVESVPMTGSEVELLAACAELQQQAARQ